MFTHFKSDRLMPILLLALLAVTPPAFAQHDYDALYIFGDSLSDAGNVWQLTGETAKAPFAIVPQRPYAIGGHHFSNGKTWAERFAQLMNLSNGGRAVLENPRVNGNYAFGGARARSGSISTSPSSVEQVQMYLADHGTASATAIYIIQFGGNDVRDALVALAPGTPAAVEEAGSIITAALADTATAIQSLYVAGARHFLVANAPSLEHVPAVIFMGAAAPAGYLTALYNGHLDGSLQALEAALPGISITTLDFAGFLDDVVQNPAAYGLTNISAPCLSFMIESEAICATPDEHLFWDGIHPTAAAHGEFAQFAATALATSR